MIRIDYSNNEIRIDTGDLSKLFSKEQLPLIFEVRKSVSNELIYTFNLDSNMWGGFPQNEIHNIIVKDYNDKFLFRYDWNVMSHGSIFYKSLWLYCKSISLQGKKPRGLVIGSHDGEFGEWVPLVKDSLSDIVLVDGSLPQFTRLVQNYQNIDGLEFLNEIVTTDGNDVTFFEGGKGYTNSVIERVIRSWETEEIKSSIRSSISINQLISEKLNNNIDWLHLDVEGLDAKLIMSLDVLPKFIIFEINNLEFSEKIQINEWLSSRNYTLHSENGICMATNLFT